MPPPITTTLPGATPATPPRRRPRPPSAARGSAPRLRREPARDLAHRGEQRQPAVVGLDRLVGDGRDPAGDERARVSGSSAACRYVKRVSRTQTRVLGRDRLLDLQEQVRGVPDLVDRGDPGAVRLVLGVRELAARSASISTMTSCPRCTSSAPAGVSATRYSCGLISLATPIRMAAQPCPAPAAGRAEGRSASRRAELPRPSAREPLHERTLVRPEPRRRPGSGVLRGALRVVSSPG